MEQKKLELLKYQVLNYLVAVGFFFKKRNVLDLDLAMERRLLMHIHIAIFNAYDLL